jgi:hypothetical protein
LCLTVQVHWNLDIFQNLNHDHDINYLVFSLLNQDLEKLETIKKQALLNPIEFVDKLTKGEDVGIPPELNIEEVSVEFLLFINIHY